MQEFSLCDLREQRPTMAAEIIIFLLLNQSPHNMHTRIKCDGLTQLSYGHG